MIYDYAPRLALRKAARRRRALFFAFWLLCLPALSWQLAPIPVATEGGALSIASR